MTDTDTTPTPDEPALIQRADLKTMSPEQIEQARVTGRLDHLLGITDRPTPNN